MPTEPEERIKTTIEGSKITWTPKDGEPVTRDIDEQLFVRPNPLTRSLCFWTYNGWRQKAYQRIYHITNLSSVAIARPLSQDEVNALVEYQTRQVLTSRIGLPIGFAAVFLHSYYDLKKINRIRPRPAGEPEVRPGWIGQTWEVIKKPLFRPGAAEPWEREVSKAFFRTALARWFFYPLSCFTFTSMWATMTYAWATTKDSRLKEWMKGLDAFREKGVQERMRTVNDHYRQQQQQQQRQAQSPGQSWEPELTEGVGDYQSTGPSTSMETPSTGDWKSQTPPDQSYNRQQQQPYRYRSEPEPTKPGDFFDDASPIAPDYQTEKPPQTYGSAWDRIRQQNMAGGWNQPQPRSRPQPVSETQRFDDYGSSREKEREQARAEFEKMLESERNMANDTSGRGGVW